MMDTDDLAILNQWAEQNRGTPVALAIANAIKEVLVHRKRLQFDPGGSDKIDELEEAAAHLRHHLQGAEKRVKELEQREEEMEAEMETATATNGRSVERIAQLEAQLAEWHRSFGGHVYVKNEDYSALVAERDQLRAQLAKRDEGERKVVWRCVNQVTGDWSEFNFEEDAREQVSGQRGYDIVEVTQFCRVLSGAGERAEALEPK